jgi:hypothetical protein
MPVLMFAGCGDDNPASVANDEAPALPDASSLSMNGSAFPAAAPSGGRTGDDPLDLVWEVIGGGYVDDKGSLIPAGFRSDEVCVG